MFFIFREIFFHIIVAFANYCGVNKSSNDLNRIFPSLEGACYTKHQYAVVGSFDNPENQSRNIHLKGISYYDNTDADFLNHYCHCSLFHLLD